MYLLLFISLAFHNFPEGLAVAASTLHSQKLGFTTTIANTIACDKNKCIATVCYKTYMLQAR